MGGWGAFPCDTKEMRSLWLQWFLYFDYGWVYGAWMHIFFWTMQNTQHSVDFFSASLLRPVSNAWPSNILCTEEIYEACSWIWYIIQANEAIKQNIEQLAGFNLTRWHNQCMEMRWFHFIYSRWETILQCKPALFKPNTPLSAWIHLPAPSCMKKRINI